MKIGIAGAGIMGRLLAWQLAEQGFCVSLFDQDPIDNGRAAAYTAAGMLTPYCELESSEHLIYEMGMLSLNLWPSLIEQWQKNCSQTQKLIGFKQRGSLVISHQLDKTCHQHFDQKLLHKLRLKDNSINSQTSQSNQNNLNNLSSQKSQTNQPLLINSSIQLLNQQQLNQLEPELSERFNHATYLPKEAWLNPQGVMQVLAENILAKGVTWHDQQKVNHVGQYSIDCSNQSYDFDVAIDCRGLGAKPAIAELRAVRGELIWLEAKHVTLTRLVRLMHPRYRLYIVPQNNNQYVIGATQIESNDYGPITVRSTLELLSAAFSIHDGFAEARVLQTKANCRPALKNNLPKIETRDGLIRINGLFRHGFLLAPVLANEVVQFLVENKNQQQLQNSHKQAQTQIKIQINDKQLITNYSSPFSQLFNPKSYSY